MTNGMFNGVKSRTRSKDIHTRHYCGPSFKEVKLPTDYTNNHTNANSTIPPSFGFTDNKTMDFSITPTYIEGHVVNITSGNEFAFTNENVKRYGYGTNDEDRGFKGWANTKDHATECVKRPQFSQLTIDPRERRPEPGLEKYVTDLEYDGPINELGMRLSQYENLRQVRKRNKQQEGVENCDHITYLGVTSIKGVIYSIVRLKNGEVRLSVGTKASEYLSSEAEDFGLTLEEITMVKLGEEYKHVERRSYDKKLLTVGQLIREERTTKQKLLESYERLAEDAESNPQLKEKYMRIIKSIEHDIETIKRYRNIEEAKENSEEESNLEKEVENSDLESENIHEEGKESENNEMAAKETPSE